jgi:hypothetical protein
VGAVQGSGIGRLLKFNLYYYLTTLYLTTADIGLQAKRLIREFYHLCKSFDVIKYLFEFVTHRQIFDFPKLFTYGYFSQHI